MICEIQNPDGSMARLPELIEYAKVHHLKLITIADLISYRLQHDRFVYRETVAQLPTQFGDFKIYAYRNSLDNTEHIALVKGDLEKLKEMPVMVRVHSECLTGDSFGSLRCDCRMQLQTAMKMIDYAGSGVIIYLRQEGRGIGLINKIKAYSLQDIGFDTVEANERLGFAPDLRDYGMGAQMLNDLGVRKIRLITNNPRKIAGLKGYGIEIVDRVPLIIEATDYNTVYLATKAEKLGHLLLQTYLITVAINWDKSQPLVKNPEAEYMESKRNKTSILSSYERLEKLRFLAKTNDLLLQEEARPVTTALFDQAQLIVNLGFDQAGVADPHWYQQLDHPYLKAITQILDQITQRPHLQKLQFIISSGVDPLTNLQVQLHREQFPLTQLPSSICQQLQPQTIYSFSS